MLRRNDCYGAGSLYYQIHYMHEPCPILSVKILIEKYQAPSVNVLLKFY